MADTPAQVALDEKGLEAATAAYNDLMFGNDAAHAAQIVRAYLSSLSSEAGDDGQGALVERARYFVENPSAWESGFDQGASDRLAEILAAYDALTRENAALRADKGRLERERDHWLGEARRLLKSGQDALDKLEAAERRLAEQGQVTVDCDRCAGNGEIVTDWDRYRHPHEGDVGDEAVAACPDCFGVGTVPVTPPSPEPDWKSAFAAQSRKLQAVLHIPGVKEALAELKWSDGEPSSEPDTLHEFKNFHRNLCERFDYCHDEKDWQRDQVSLIEHIARKVSPEPDAELMESLAQFLHDEVEWPEFDYPDRSWPEHEGDTGQRGDGWLKIVPPDVCEQFRDIARRLARHRKQGGA